MDFQLTETQTLVRDTARAFAERVLRPNAAAFERAESIPAAVLSEMAELGLMGVNVPAALGGAEAGAVAYALAMMEIARGCASTAVTMAVNNMVAEVIAPSAPTPSASGTSAAIASGQYSRGIVRALRAERRQRPGLHRHHGGRGRATAG
jgi:alkylation response protein AidB-like acyl-CoA dehydrogenase